MLGENPYVDKQALWYKAVNDNLKYYHQIKFHCGKMHVVCDMTSSTGITTSYEYIIYVFDKPLHHQHTFYIATLSLILMWTYKCGQCVYTYIRSNFAKNKLAFLLENYYKS